VLNEVSIPVLTVIIGGIVTIIAAAAAAAVTIIKALREVGVTVAKIEGRVNGDKGAVDEQVRAKDREIELLREMLHQERKAAALLAQAAAARTRGSALPETP